METNLLLEFYNHICVTFKNKKHEDLILNWKLNNKISQRLKCIANGRMFL